MKRKLKLGLIAGWILSLILMAIVVNAIAQNAGNFQIIGGGPYPGAASVTCYTADSVTAYSKNQYGVQSTGSTNQSLIINNALNSLTAGRIWKQTVKFIGNFLLTNSIKIPSYTILDLTEANIKAAASCAILSGHGMIENYHFADNPDSNIEIIGGTIDGNKANNAVDFEGIFLSMTNNFLIHDTVIHDSPEVGLALYPSTTGHLMNGKIENVESYNNDADGLQLEMAITNAKGAQITIQGGRFHDNGANGLNMKCTTAFTEPPLLNILVDGVEADHNHDLGIGLTMASQGLKKVIFINNHVHDNNQTGLWLQQITYATVSNNIAERNGHAGIDLWGSKSVTVQGNIAIDNNQGSAGIMNNEAGISVFASDNITVIGNICKDDQTVKTQKWGIKIDAYTGTYNNFIVEGNDLTGNKNGGLEIYGGSGTGTLQNLNINNNNLLDNPTPLSMATGTFNGLHIHENLGFITENSGVANVTGSVYAVTVPHGLAVTPTIIIITPQQGGHGSYEFVNNAGTTTFNINFPTAPGSDTWYFYWDAKAYP